VMYVVYAIRSKSSGKIYIGCTNNFNRRIGEHNDPTRGRKNRYTRVNKGPWELIYEEPFDDKKSTLKREKQLKSHQGRDFIKKKISGR
jgi:putative endonuclease